MTHKKSPEQMSLEIIEETCGNFFNEGGGSRKFDLATAIAKAIREARQVPSVSEDEIVRAASARGFTMEGGHHVGFLQGAKWAKERMNK